MSAARDVSGQLAVLFIEAILNLTSSPQPLILESTFGVLVLVECAACKGALVTAHVC